MFVAPNALAQQVDVIPAQTTGSEDIGATHPAVKLTPDKSEIIGLDREAFTIVVGNPAHLSVLADSSKRLVLVPQVPGSTYFTVLDQNGDVIMQRHVIVASPQKNYMRVRRACAANAKGCATTSVYYCPDMCHEIAVPGTVTEGSGETVGAGQGGDGAVDEEAVVDLADGTAEPADQ